MLMSNTTLILIDTAILSKIISDTLDEVGAPSSKKSACLNRAAARIAGTKHNWGYLTGHGGQITAQGVDNNSTTTDPEDVIREGAEMALLTHPMTPKELASSLAVSLTKTYLQIAPTAIDDFTAAEEVAKDLTQNHQNLITIIAHEGMHIDYHMRQNHQALDDIERKVQEKEAGAAAPTEAPEPEISRVKVNELIGFMLNDPNMSATLTRYMSVHSNEVQDSFNNGITPAMWQRAAAVIQKAKAIKPEDEKRPGEMAKVARFYVKSTLGPHAETVLKAAGL